MRSMKISTKKLVIKNSQNCRCQVNKEFGQQKMSKTFLKNVCAKSVGQYPTSLTQILNHFYSIKSVELAIFSKC